VPRGDGEGDRRQTEEYDSEGWDDTSRDKMIRFLQVRLPRGLKTAKSRCLGNDEAYYPRPYFVCSCSITVQGDSPRPSRSSDPSKTARTQDGPPKPFAAQCIRPEKRERAS
jgi:hypothetical protein